MRATRLALVALLLLLVIGLGAVNDANAHSDLASTSPAAESTVPQPPATVTMTFTQSLFEGAQLTVTDGCQRNVGGQATADGTTLSAPVDSGQPGAWTVTYNIVSAEDGHASNGQFAFTVEGDADCSATTTSDATPTTAGDTTTTDDTEGAQPASDTEDDEGSDFPVLPVIAGGAVVLAVIAFVARRATRT